MVDTNDGIIASAGIVEGLIGAGASTTILHVASLAAMIGGGLAMGGMRYAEAADERDAQQATLEAERRRLDLTPAEEEVELAELYEAKGLSPQLARAVAAELSARDALAAHAEAEYGISLRERPATPWVTAVTAGLAFVLGAGVPLLVVLLAPPAWRGAVTILAVVLALSLTALVIAALGGTRISRTLFRTVSIGVGTMVLTYLGGSLFG
ncbi:MAG: VIT1/CCC1 transporter family protein [Pseudonocardia sp.]|nr:VIT1/CCC1 transporter family protein [Pseudonocardia sp.]